jgi:hypothetical protein
MRQSSHAVRLRTLPHRRRHVTGPARLSRLRKWGVYGVAIGIWASGVLWLGLHYSLRVKSEFGFQTNPGEPWMLKLHGAFAFAALVGLGLLWGVHILNGWFSHRRRRSGGIVFGLACFLGLSGYLLYYVGEDDFRDVVSVAHWAVGIAAIGFFLWHRFWDERNGA